MSAAEKSGLVIATNGILNETQRAGELAVQNATPNDKRITGETGDSKPDLLLVYSPYAGNFVSDLLVAGYEKFLVPIFGPTESLGDPR